MNRICKTIDQPAQRKICVVRAFLASMLYLYPLDPFAASGRLPCAIWRLLFATTKCGSFAGILVKLFTMGVTRRAFARSQAVGLLGDGVPLPGT